MTSSCVRAVPWHAVVQLHREVMRHANTAATPEDILRQVAHKVHGERRANACTSYTALDGKADRVRNVPTYAHWPERQDTEHAFGVTWRLHRVAESLPQNIFGCRRSIRVPHGT